MANRIRLGPFPQVPEEPQEEILFASPWIVQSDVEGIDPDHFDYLVDLRFERTVTIWPKKVREHCALSSQASVAIFAEWTTDLTSYVRGRGPIQAVQVNEANTVEVSAELGISGAEIGGTLSLETFLVLLDEPAPLPGGPHLPGSVLWSSREKHVLEAPGSRLPVCVVKFEDFPEQFEHPFASWMVEILPDGLRLPPSVGMQIYINSRYPELIDLLSASDLGYPADLVVQMMYFDIGRQLISRAVADDDFCDGEVGYPQASLGASLRHRAKLVFPQLQLSQVAALSKESPDKFEAAIQNSLLTLRT